MVWVLQRSSTMEKPSGLRNCRNFALNALLSELECPSQWSMGITALIESPIVWSIAAGRFALPAGRQSTNTCLCLEELQSSMREQQKTAQISAKRRPALRSESAKHVAHLGDMAQSTVVFCKYAGAAQLLPVLVLLRERMLAYTNDMADYSDQSINHSSQVLHAVQRQHPAITSFAECLLHTIFALLNICSQSALLDRAT